MSFKFGYLGGSNIGESYNRLLSTSDLKDLDKEEEYLILFNNPYYFHRTELGFLKFDMDFEYYNDEVEEYQNKPTWIIDSPDRDDFEATDLESKFLILNKDDWKF